MKQIKFFLFIICFLSAININAEVYEGSCGANVKYSLDSSTGVLSITGTGKMTDFTPYGPWNSHNSIIKLVEISEGVTSIGNNAFSRCSGLTEVTIPNSVTSIGNYAFYECSALTAVTIPNNVTSIGDAAFYGCTGLATFEIPNSVTAMGVTPFHNTTWYNNQLDGMIYVGNIAYEYKGTMPENTSIKLEERTLGVAGGAFFGCSGLTSIIIPNNVTSIGDRAFQSCSGLTSVTIPNSVTSIGVQVFYNCSRLTTVSISSGIKFIGGYAFGKCSDLVDVYCHARKGPTMGTDIFRNSDIQFATLYVPEASINGYKAASPWSEFGNIVSLEGTKPTIIRGDVNGDGIVNGTDIQEVINIIVDN